ncbi:MAG: 50S ribosomal protein L24 [Candidatus Peregrinibacteria bacterium]|nr:50S ribosomal protein L24 [Candidatus Peregrinibacteria bacterium]
MKLKNNDQVVVIAGKEKGKKGKITKILSKQERIVVEKLNIRTKHIKKSQGRAGERVQFEAPMHISNVMLLCPNCEKMTRVGYKKLTTGKKQRICKKCKESIDKESKK